MRGEQGRVDVQRANIVDYDTYSEAMFGGCQDIFEKGRFARPEKSSKKCNWEPPFGLAGGIDEERGSHYTRFNMRKGTFMESSIK